ncbi:SET domain-containing protein [Cryptosporidium canis]|nr:SET domain-containing protein [Cryptosporidium canis]
MWNFPDKVGIREDGKKGRCVVARTDIKRGESILMEEAYCRILFSENREEICDSCLNYLETSGPRSGQTTECPGCKRVRFCSKECLEGVKKLHDLECGLLRLGMLEMISNKVGVSFDRSRLLTRFVIQLILELSGASKDRSGQEVGYLTSSLDHIRLLKDNIEECPEGTLETYRNLALEILRIPTLGAEIDRLTQKEVFTEDLLVKVLCIIDSNSFGIPKFPLKGPELPATVAKLLRSHGAAAKSSLELSSSLLNPSIIGWGLFSYSSLFNHSCDPNCDFIGVNPASDCSSTVIDLRASRNIKKDEEITINYVELYDTRRNRIKSLLQTKHFICECERCTAPFQSSTDSLIQGFVCSKCYRISDLENNNLPVIQLESAPSSLDPKEIISILDDQDYLISQLTGSYKCHSCGEVYFGSEVAAIQNEFLDTLQEAETLNSQKGDLPAAINLILSLVQKYHTPNIKSVFPHPLNYLLYRCYKLLTFWSVAVKDWNSVNQYVSRMIHAHLRVLQNQCNIEISNLHSTKAIALSHLGLASESDQEWKKCTEVRQICLGIPSNLPSVHSIIHQKHSP